MSTFYDHFVMASQRGEEYYNQQLGLEMIHAQSAELELGPNTNALALRIPFDPVTHDLVSVKIFVTWCNGAAQ